MTPEESKAYQRGYRAGRQTAKERRAVERIRREKQAMLDRIYLVMLPVTMGTPLARGGVPIVTTNERIDTAAEWTVLAFKRRPMV